MIPLRGDLKFTTYNSGKVSKYGVLVRVACEALLGCFRNVEIYGFEGKELEKTVFSA
jgi:hypothetical protein